MSKKKAITSEKAVYQNIRTILVTARQKVYTAVNSTMVEAYWEIGKQIEQAVGDRAEYGKGLLLFISAELTAEFGKGFDETNLRKMRQFYQVFPIRDALRLELSWTHYRLLMKIDNTQRRDFYLNECAESNWSSRQLERQINSFYYDRLLATQKKDKKSVKDEIHKTEPKSAPDYILKDPYILEFLDLKDNKKYHESELEHALIDKLQEFLLELGKGFAFVSRQQIIKTDTSDFYIDLVFYNFFLKCFVLIELKTTKITHQDIGQLDMYVRMFDDLKKQEEDNPTIGILLCTETDKTIAKYSVLNENKQLFAAKYMPYLPTEEELITEIEHQKEILKIHNDIDKRSLL